MKFIRKYLTIEIYSGLCSQVATLANKFLHASYWFLVLGVTFSAKQLDGLARWGVLAHAKVF